MSETNNSYYQLSGSIITHNSSLQPILSESSSSLSTENNTEFPVLLLTQQPDSHHFNERRIVLNDTIKVGRSVARARPSDVNAIFDCKVLSRNHAIFWYENGKVLLRDTKSSNGTFVNSQLLSKGTEDSPPREIYSGDIIQFGVEVIENTTTHGCIIAQVSIFMSDGSEIRRHPDMAGLSSGSIPISNCYEEQIYQLAQYIQEAAHREQTLEKKLNSLSQLIIDTQEASDSSWKVILNQDRLMEKLEMLQEQVELHSKGDEHDSLTLELRNVLEQRYGLERESKNLLERLIQEKAEVLQRVVDLEHSLEVSEGECSQLRSAFEILQQEHGKISSKVVAGKDEVEALQKKLQEAQHEYTNEMSIVSADKEALLQRYSKLCEEAEQLRSRLESMELEIAEGQHSNFRNESKEMGKLRDMLHESSERQMGLLSSVKGIQSQLTKALISEIMDLQTLNCLEDSMAGSETDLDSFLMGTTSELALHFIYSYRHIRDGMEVIDSLKDEVHRLQQSLPIDKSTESNLNELDTLIGKMSEFQTKTRSMLTEIPDKLLGTVMVHCGADNVDKSHKESFSDSEISPPKGISTQTDSVDLVHSEVQWCTDIQTKCAHIQTVSVNASIDPQTISNLETDLDQYMIKLDAEKKMTGSLKKELMQLQRDKHDLQEKINKITVEYEEMKKQLEESKIDSDLRKEATQRVSASEYGQLYQESQKLRMQVQEIEEEMITKRKEYDTLYEQYEALLSGEKLPQLQSKAMNDKIKELEDLCAKQREEIEEMHESMNDKYQAVLARSKRISAISTVPLCALIIAILIFILSFLGRPFFG